MSSVKMCKYCDIDQDCEYEIEESLQKIRLCLIRMLDEFEGQSCTCCRLLHCGYQQAALTPPHSLTSETGYDFRIIARPVARPRPRPNMDSIQPTRASPLPTRVPQESRTGNGRPINDVESWVRASTPNPETTESPGCKPIGHIDQLSSPVPTTVWNDYKKTKPEVNTSSVSLAGNVEEFFKSFRARMQISGNSAYEQNQALMQQLKFSMAERQKEESEGSSPRPD